MRRPLLAATATLLAGVAVMIVILMGGTTAASHGHSAAEPSRVTTVAASIAAATSVEIADPVADHSAHTEGVAASSSASGGSKAAQMQEMLLEAVPPDGDPAGHRQISLGEAAGIPVANGASDVPVAATLSKWIDAQALGVNDGTKQQAESVRLYPARVIDPTEVLPDAGQISGCVLGYGRGATCLPQTPPSHAGHGLPGAADMSGYWTCVEVRTLLPEGIILDDPASDRLGLDSNFDGTACGSGDS